MHGRLTYNLSIVICAYSESFVTLYQRMRKNLEFGTWKKWKVRLACQTSPVCNTCLTRKKPTKKSKDALSAKARVKPEVCMKIKLRSIYIKRRKQKKNIVAQPTHRVYLLGETLSLQSFSFFLLLVIHHFLPLTP